ncbi:hypothetical protein IFM89_028897 [Coptis chinensis]|uniref:Uncharacterized protein n=1 Tax=Coptis chinensis TaxID=261450 RepID=A0A835H8F4_9MAGN|nr:hypothetical protein IFM89_028897 [Coptis chinensis]
MKMPLVGSRTSTSTSSRRRFSILVLFPLQGCLLISAIFTGLGLLFLTLNKLTSSHLHHHTTEVSFLDLNDVGSLSNDTCHDDAAATCATVEEMGEVFASELAKGSLRVRKIIENHFLLHGTCEAKGKAVDVEVDAKEKDKPKKEGKLKLCIDGAIKMHIEGSASDVTELVKKLTM